MPNPAPCVLSLGLLALCSAVLPGAAAAQGLLDCVLPLRPSPVSDARILSEYAEEIREEYAIYFDEAQAFFRCIERVRVVITEDVNQAIIDYGAIESVPPD